MCSILCSFFSQKVLTKFTQRSNIYFNNRLLGLKCSFENVKAHDER
jgi:hypothetical protein